MIDLGLSDDYLKGFNARCKNIPFDGSQSDEWKQGWKNAHWQKKSETITKSEPDNE